jgi:hypothetical protein
VGVAVIGQQELHRRVRHSQSERPFDHCQDLCFPVGHIQRVGETTLESLTSGAFFDVIKGDIQRRAHLADLASGVNLDALGQVACRHLFEDLHCSAQARGDATGDDHPSPAGEYQRGEHEGHNQQPIALTPCRSDSIEPRP